MSPTGLQKLVDGGSPYTATRKRLERWFIKESSRYVAETSPESARAALAILTHDLSPGDRSEVIARLLAVLESQYKEVGDRTPAWIKDLKRKYR